MNSSKILGKLMPADLPWSWLHNPGIGQIFSWYEPVHTHPLSWKDLIFSGWWPQCFFTHVNKHFTKPTFKTQPVLCFWSLWILCSFLLPKKAPLQVLAYKNPHRNNKPVSEYSFSFPTQLLFNQHNYHILWTKALRIAFGPQNHWSFQPELFSF